MEHTAGSRTGISGYSAGCRCDDCTQAKSRWNKDYEKRSYFGNRKVTVDATPVAKHLHWLMDNGVGYTWIAQLLGHTITAQHLYRIANGRTKRVRVETARAILAIDRDTVSDKAYVDSGLTWRRLRGLIALGYSTRWLNEQLGYPSNRRSLVMGRTRTTVKKARAVAELCRLYGTTPGPSERSRGNGERLGWLPYGEWDDDLNEVTDKSSFMCGHCGVRFTHDKPGRPPEYCGESCRHAAGRDRAKEALSA